MLSIKRLNSYFKLRRLLNRNLVKHFSTQSESLLSDCVHNARGWDAGRTRLGELLDTHVQYVKAKITPRVRRTRTITTTSDL